MNAAVTQRPKPIRQDLRYYVPRWMVFFLAITLIQELTTLPPIGHGLWSIPNLILIGLSEGAFGGLLFVGLERWWNPRDCRAIRIRNCLLAVMAVGVGSLIAMTAIYR
jgi:hypothetical protein